MQIVETWKTPKEMRLFFSLAPELDVAGCCMNMQHRTAAIEAAFGESLARTDVSGARDFQLRKVAAYSVTPRHLHGCTNCHAEIVWDIDDDGTHGSFQSRIRKRRAF